MKISTILSPIALAAYAILALYAQNSNEVPFSAVTRSLVVSVGGAAILLLILYLITKDVARAGLITVMAVGLFFSYGHLYAIAKTWKVGSITIGRHSLLLPIWGALLLIWGWWITRKLPDPKRITNFFGVFSLILILFPILTLVDSQIRGNRGVVEPRLRSDTEAETEETAFVRPEGEVYPDIYYIILDGYGRQDVLKELYDYDNTEFIDFLERNRFYVARESRGNYIKTLWSLSSSLNMSYVNYLTEIVGEGSKDRGPLKALLGDNQVQTFLKSLAYQVVSFDSGYEPVTLPETDSFYAVDPEAGPFRSLNIFEGILLESTLLRAIQDLHFIEHPIVQELLSGSEYELHRDRITFTFDTLKDIPGREGHHFVYAHIVAPHPPFVFGPNGEKLNPDRAFSFNDGSHFRGTREEYIQGYRNQLLYINQLVMQTIEEILARSDSPPVIILQGDHGPGAYLDWDSATGTNLQERLSILNAYYFPDRACEQLYPSISPVNSFRVVFNCLFETNYERLEDESYYARHKTPYDYIRVTEQLLSR